MSTTIAIETTYSEAEMQGQLLAFILCEVEGPAVIAQGFESVTHYLQATAGAYADLAKAHPSDKAMADHAKAAAQVASTALALGAMFSEMQVFGPFGEKGKLQ